MALYEACGVRRIPPFGPYAGDPTSVRHELELRAAPAPELPRAGERAAGD